MARNELGRMINDIRTASTEIAYNSPARVAENIVRELQIKGPGWTGRFSNSWSVKTPLTTVSGSEAAGQAQRLDIPRIGNTQTKRLLKGNTLLFSVYNTASYAGIAVDKEQGVFVRIGTPIKPIEETGTRVDRIRGKLEGTGGNSRTAPYNWFTKYVLAGEMAKTITTTLTRALR